MAGAYVPSHLDASGLEDPTVQLTCSAADASAADVYAPTGEPIDATIVVSAPRAE